MLGAVAPTAVDRNCPAPLLPLRAPDCAGNARLRRRHAAGLQHKVCPVLCVRNCGHGRCARQLLDDALQQKVASDLGASTSSDRLAFKRSDPGPKQANRQIAVIFREHLPPGCSGSHRGMLYRRCSEELRQALQPAVSHGVIDLIRGGAKPGDDGRLLALEFSRSGACTVVRQMWSEPLAELGYVDPQARKRMPQVRDLRHEIALGPGQRTRSGRADGPRFCPGHVELAAKRSTVARPVPPAPPGAGSLAGRFGPGSRLVMRAASQQIAGRDCCPSSTPAPRHDPTGAGAGSGRSPAAEMSGPWSAGR